jgi:hypothetical protein
MEDIIRFVQNFVTQEYEVMIQIRAESDTSLVISNLNKLNEYFEGLNSGLHLSSSRVVEDRNDVLGQLQPRVLFKIEQYANPALGAIYRVYLSSEFRGDQNYFSNFFIANTEKGLKIIARYTLCDYCKGVGTRKGILCDECHGLGWNWRGGEKLEQLGEKVATREFALPTNEA